MDDESRTFTLYGTREILETNEPPPIIEDLVNRLEKAVSSGSPIAFELAKSLIDSVCKTVLKDRGVEVEGDWDTPRLFRETITNLNFIPDGHPDPQGFHERIIITLRGLQQTVRGLCELRNRDGIVAHGADGYQEVLFPYQAKLAARASDAIVPFIFSAHKKTPSDLNEGRIYYDDYPEFNNSLDETVGSVELVGQIFLPSWIIYTNDKNHITYRELLIEFTQSNEDQIGQLG